MSILVKKHVRNNKLILAVCDSGLIGKKYIEKESQLDLTGDFYKGDLSTEEQITVLFNQADIINLVGKDSIELALNHKILDKSSIKVIDKIPHAQIFRL